MRVVQVLLCAAAAAALLVLPVAQADRSGEGSRAEAAWLATAYPSSGRSVVMPPPTPHPQARASALVGSRHATPAVTINWDDVVITSRTTTTLQVVSNPLLARSCPVAANAFKSLGALNATLVRYVPWFPYPHIAVAELDPPNKATMTTSWNFTFTQPMLEDFMDAVGEENALPNYSTQPTWLYNTNDWSYPADPMATDFGYPRGNALRDPSGKDLAAYFVRLLSWLRLGGFTDEFGVKHTGGHTYDFPAWELYNEPEGCHGLTAAEYTRQYDLIVSEVQKAVDPQHKIQWMGLALEGHNEWEWYETFFNESNHPLGSPRDYASFHFYAGSKSRDNPLDFEGFFSAAAGFVEEVKNITAIRDRMSPHTKLDCDEMGVILPGDNSPTASIPPPVYWNAAGAMYAYLFGELVSIGMDVLGQSQLAGSPPMPQWGIPDPQYPSVSLLNWTTGAGNARYWVLKTLIEHFGHGDLVVKTAQSFDPMCGVVDGQAGYGTMSLACADPSAVIDSIDFADFGTPGGTCGAYAANATCTSSNATAVVTALCKGKNSCNVQSYPLFGDPCYGTVKRLVVQARCSGSSGGAATPSPQTATFVQGFKTAAGVKKVLLVNKVSTQSTVSISGDRMSGTRYTIDEATGDGPARQETFSANSFDLAPFAVAVLVMAA